MNNKGFTLIELILFIIIGAIFLPASMIAFTSVMSNYSRPDYYVKVGFYAEKQLAWITSKPYDDIRSNTCPADDGSEGYTTSCTIEFINPDDFSTTSPSTDYKRITVKVAYSRLWSDYTISTIVARRPKQS